MRQKLPPLWYLFTFRSDLILSSQKSLRPSQFSSGFLMVDSWKSLINTSSDSIRILNSKQRSLVSSKDVAISSDKNQYGGQIFRVIASLVISLSKRMMRKVASTMGIQFDSEIRWAQKKQLFKISSLIIKTSNSPQSATEDKNGLWTKTVAVAVFVPARNGRLTTPSK